MLLKNNRHPEEPYNQDLKQNEGEAVQWLRTVANARPLLPRLRLTVSQALKEQCSVHLEPMLNIKNQRQ